MLGCADLALEAPPCRGPRVDVGGPAGSGVDPTGVAGSTVDPTGAAGSTVNPSGTAGSTVPTTGAAGQTGTPPVPESSPSCSTSGGTSPLASLLLLGC